VVTKENRGGIGNRRKCCGNMSRRRGDGRDRRQRDRVGNRCIWLRDSVGAGQVGPKPPTCGNSDCGRGIAESTREYKGAVLGRGKAHRGIAAVIGAAGP
jgi:hypothetical protein